MECELCRDEGGLRLWRDGFCRIVRASTEDHPGFYRVVLNRHVAEMTDLASAERDRLMRAVFACESAVRALLAPDKVNLASLGNQVPHLHWHVVARYRDDRHFPDPIWAPPRREAVAPPAADDRAFGERLAALLGRAAS